MGRSPAILLSMVLYVVFRLANFVHFFGVGSGSTISDELLGVCVMKVFVNLFFTVQFNIQLSFSVGDHTGLSIGCAGMPTGCLGHVFGHVFGDQFFYCNFL